jgi:multiple sugar transport system substrate-binding protein
MASVIQRHTQDVVFGRATPSAAADAFKTEAQGLIDSAS